VARLVDEDEERKTRDGDGDVHRRSNKQIALTGREKRYAFAFGMTQKRV
jgi:hypothetical protein